MERADVRRAVAEETDRHLLRFLVLRRPAGADRDAQLRADDRIRSHRELVGLAEMHRTALAREHAVGAPEQFGHAA